MRRIHAIHESFSIPFHPLPFFTRLNAMPVHNIINKVWNIFFWHYLLYDNRPNNQIKVMFLIIYLEAYSVRFAIIQFSQHQNPLEHSIRRDRINLKTIQERSRKLISDNGS